MRSLILIAAFLASGTASADLLNDYLFSADKDLRTRLQMPAVPRAPWIDNLELRLTPEQDEFDLRSETYSFRFRPTSIKERRALRAVFSTENEIASIEWRRALSKAMARRYLDLIDLAEQEVRTAMLRRQLRLDQSAFAAARAVSASSRFDSSDLQDAALRVERRKQELQQALQKTVLLRAATVSDLLVVTDEHEPAVSPQLVMPRQILATLDVLAADSAPHITTQAQAEVRRAESEVQLEKSRSRFGINLLELSYEDKVTDSYNVTLGFRIPLGRDRFGLQKRVREANVLRHHAYLAEQMVNDEIRAMVREIRWKIDVYDMDKAAIRALQERIGTTAGDVASLLSLRQHQLDLLNSAAGTHIDLLRDYVSLLDLLGALQQQPQRNWIRS